MTFQIIYGKSSVRYKPSDLRRLKILHMKEYGNWFLLNILLNLAILTASTSSPAPRGLMVKPLEVTSQIIYWYYVKDRAYQFTEPSEIWTPDCFEAKRLTTELL